MAPKGMPRQRAERVIVAADKSLERLTAAAN
jgi:hypothetical protein